MRKTAVNKGKTCKAKGCNLPAKCKGHCLKHYTRIKRTGSSSGFRKNGRPARGYVSCNVNGCVGNAHTRGMCSLHYQRYLRHGDPTKGRKRASPRPDVCIVKGCENPVKANEWCGMHYARWRRTGDPEGFSDWYKKRFDKVVDESGYVMVYQPDHPNARKGGRVPEHRLVISEMLGRPLLNDENVHHRNGNKQDNRPSNLELWVSTQPSGQRPYDLVAWALDLLSRYGQEVFELEESETSGWGKPPRLRFLLALERFQRSGFCKVLTRHRNSA